MCSVNTRLKSAKKVGLALGSGSARGWTHIGVIRALAEAGIRIHCVAGTSIGAVVGAVFASGKLDTFEEIVIGFDWKQIARFFDVVFPKSGLIDGKKVADFVRGHVRGENIEDLPIPFSAVATDLATGREVIIQDGDLIEAIRASISVPGIFTPVRREGSILADGRLVNPVPVTVITGLNPVASNLDAILAQLKSACAAGGTISEGRVEIQGDHRERALSILRDLGYLAKLSGG